METSHFYTRISPRTVFVFFCFPFLKVVYRILCTVYHTPLGQLSMVNFSTAGIVLIVSVPKTSALGTSRGELSENVSFGIGTLLVVEQSSLENRTRGV